VKRLIDVLLKGGPKDHYIVPAEMNAKEVEVDGEVYVRTDHIRRVRGKRGGEETKRVYECCVSDEQ